NGAVVNYVTPVGTDNCTVTTALTAGLADGATFPIGITEVTYTATDGSGNTASASFNVEVSGLAPDIVVPANITVNNDSGVCGAVVNFTATETTAIPTSTISYDIDPNTLFAIGTTTVTATATNAVGESSQSFTVTVIDNEAPVITMNGDAVVTHEAYTSYTDAGATTTDNCSATLATDNPVDVNTPGSYTVTYTATDASNNVTTMTRTVNIVDSIDPALTVGDINVNTDADVCGATIASFGASATDASGAPSIVFDIPEGTLFSVGTTAVTATATDANNNVTTGIFNVTVTDVEPPVITTQAATVQLNQNGFGSIILDDILLSSSDACGIASEVASQLNFDCTNVGANAVTITVTDNNGQITRETVNVQVLDVLPIIAEADSFTLNTCEPIMFTTADLLGNDSDPYGEALKIDFVGQPSTGTIVDNNNGTFTYTPGVSTNHTTTAEYLVKRDDGTIVFSGNGHFYEFVSAPGISWTDAKAQAEARTYNGQSGYLVTITSAAENQFAFDKIKQQGWIGASDAEVEGQWKWVGGPEAGQVFWSGLANGGPVNGAYNAWGGGEPNNAGNEDYAHFRSDARWNDLPVSVGGGIRGYVVEYGGNSGDCDIESTATASISFELIDTVDPIAQTQNITVQLDASGNVSITPEDVDNNSNDACGIQSLALDITSFDCTDVGQNTVTLTVTDVNNNVSTATAV
ncbi:unnamed protein product, partial [Discosporangium mesarthrocarpum]